MVRIKQRYILGEIIFDGDGGKALVPIDLNTLTQKKILDSFRAAVQDAYGDLGIA